MSDWLYVGIYYFGMLIWCLNDVFKSFGDWVIENRRISTSFGWNYLETLNNEAICEGFDIPLDLSNGKFLF